jgi:hypothetical protein
LRLLIVNCKLDGPGGGTEDGTGDCTGNGTEIFSNVKWPKPSSTVHCDVQFYVGIGPPEIDNGAVKTLEAIPLKLYRLFCPSVLHKCSKVS